MAVSAQYELCTMLATIPGLSIIMLVLFTILQRRATQHATLLHIMQKLVSISGDYSIGVSL